MPGIKVLETATLFAGPLAATYLGDFGADVLKIEHPTQPDAARGHGASKNGVGLWWQTIGRNKRTVTLELSEPEGQDVLIENFRPGTLERWNLAPGRLHERNPGLVLARVTAFGQIGPYSTVPASVRWPRR
jgi:crotonobetainyl-CoA:carnitine CoA-transferase CaiB-like acyl-CoA transferase